MLTTIETIKHNIKMRFLERRFDSVLNKMKKHEGDTDTIEWKKWSLLGIDCLKAMDREQYNYYKKTH